VAIRDDLRADMETLWSYHDLRHALQPCDVGVGLGSHELGVAVVAVDLFHRGMFPWLVFTGANSPTTMDRFPHGEAVHYRQYAVTKGVPPGAVLVEGRATNTGENLRFTRDLLAERGIEAHSVLLMCRPYQQRRAFATCRKLWPEVEVVCASRPLPLDEYVRGVGDANRVIDMLVGDTQRIEEYPKRGFAIPQEMPEAVRAAYRRLVDAGFTGRLLPGH
jgi:uncharacterized SAM-binding protein YcdF (DUF218 family)